MTSIRQYRVLLADEAKNDLKQIHHYILTNFYSHQAADAKIDLILTALSTLGMFPEACPLVSSRGYGELTDDGQQYRYMPIENYIAFYTINANDVNIARILNSRQDWAKLLLR